MRNVNVNTINGDGNAIGNGNRITFVKKDERHVHHHGGKNAEDGSEAAAFAVPVIAFVGIAASSYFFALHADQVYWALKGIFFLELMLVTAAGWWEIRKTNDWPAAQVLVLMLITAGAMVGGHFIHVGYGAEVTSWATGSGSFGRFWCLLPDEWRRFAVLHVLTASFGLALGGAALVLPIAEAVRHAFAGRPVENWGGIVVATLAIGGAIVLHTDAVAPLTAKLQMPAGFFCSR